MFDRQDHESSRPAEKRVLTLITHVVFVVTKRRLHAPEGLCVTFGSPSMWVIMPFNRRQGRSRFTTAMSTIIMAWETPSAQVASNAVGQLCPAHSGGNEELHSVQGPEQNRIAWDCNEMDATYSFPLENALVTLLLATVATVMTLSNTPDHKGLWIAVNHRFVNGPGAGGCLLVRPK